MSIDGVSFFFFFVVSFQHFIKNIKNTTNHHHNDFCLQYQRVLKIFLFSYFENCQKNWLNIFTYGGLSLEQQHHKLKLKKNMKKN
jgi:hypothetical protein